MKPFFYILIIRASTMKNDEKNKSTLKVSIFGASTFVFLMLVVTLLFGGVINHPGHCGATNPHTLDYESLFSDGGSILKDAGTVNVK